MSPAQKSSLANIVGLQLGFLPVRYLGVPLSCRKLFRSDCKPLLEKITSRITSWAARLLSYAGRLQLIESVLASLYGYWCSIFLLPVHLIKAVESVCCAFLWKGHSGTVTGARVSWDHLCKPKSEGGLGLKRAAEWNKACLARLFWLLFNGSDSMWFA